MNLDDGLEAALSAMTSVTTTPVKSGRAQRARRTPPEVAIRIRAEHTNALRSLNVSRIVLSYSAVHVPQIL